MTRSVQHFLPLTMSTSHIRVDTTTVFLNIHGTNLVRMPPFHTEMHRLQRSSELSDSKCPEATGAQKDVIKRPETTKPRHDVL